MKKLITLFMLLPTAVAPASLKGVFYRIETLLGPRGDLIILISDLHNEDDEKRKEAAQKVSLAQSQALKDSLIQYPHGATVLVEDPSEPVSYGAEKNKAWLQAYTRIALALPGYSPGGLNGLIDSFRSNPTFKAISVKSIEPRIVIDFASAGLCNGQVASDEIHTIIKTLHSHQNPHDAIGSFICTTLEAMMARDKSFHADIQAGIFCRHYDQYIARIAALSTQNSALFTRRVAAGRVTQLAGEWEEGGAAQATALKEYSDEDSAILARETGRFLQHVGAYGELVELLAIDVINKEAHVEKPIVMLTGGRHGRSMRLILTKLMKYKPLITHGSSSEINLPPSSVYRTTCPWWFKHEPKQTLTTDGALTPQQIIAHFTKARSMLNRITCSGCRLK